MGLDPLKTWRETSEFGHSIVIRWYCLGRLWIMHEVEVALHWRK